MTIKKRDIPDTTRPLALQNFERTLGETDTAKRVMKALGEYYLKGNDYFGSTRHIHFHNRVLSGLSHVPDPNLKKVMARDYKQIMIDRIKANKLPPFIERNMLSLVTINHKNFIKTTTNP